MVVRKDLMDVIGKGVGDSAHFAWAFIKHFSKSLN